MQGLSKLRCSQCGSDNIFFQKNGNEIRGNKKAECGDCGHEEILNSWDNSHEKIYVLDANEIDTF